MDWSQLPWKELGPWVVCLALICSVVIVYITNKFKGNMKRFSVEMQPQETTDKDIIIKMVDKMTSVIESNANSTSQLTGAIQELSANQKHIAANLTSLSTSVTSVQNDMAGVKNDIEALTVKTSQLNETIVRIDERTK